MSCDEAVRTGTNGNAIVRVGCTPMTGTYEGKRATETGVERRVSMTRCDSSSGTVVRRGCCGRGRVCGSCLVSGHHYFHCTALGNDCDYNRDTFLEFGCGCVSVYAGNPYSLRRLDVGERGFACPSNRPHCHLSSGTSIVELESEGARVCRTGLHARILRYLFVKVKTNVVPRIFLVLLGDDVDASR